jgi:hypothetical protein
LEVIKLVFSFKLSNDSVIKLGASKKQLGKVSEFLSTATVVLTPPENKLSIYYSGNRSVAKFDIDMTDFKEIKKDATPLKLTYFGVRIDTFLNIVEKAIATKDIVEFRIDTETNKVNIAAGKAKFSTTCYDSSTLDVGAVQDTIDSIALLQNGTEFTQNTVTMDLTPEVISFYDSIIGTMGSFGKGNAIAIEGNKLKYSDSLSIIEFNTSNPIIPSGSEYLHSLIYQMLQSTLAKVDKFSVVYSNSRQYVFIDNPLFGMKALIGVPDVSFKYPTDDELVGFAPKEDTRLTLAIEAGKLKTALDTFKGVFDAAVWKLQQIKFKLNAESISNKQLLLSWSDFNAEADTDCEINTITTLGTVGADISFIIPSAQLGRILATTPDDELVELVVNDLATVVENGPGISIKTSKYKAVIAKLTE